MAHPFRLSFALVRPLLAAALIALGCTLHAAQEPLADESHWQRIDGTYWRYLKPDSANPARIQRNVFAGTKGGNSATLTQTTAIPVQGGGRYELSGVYSATGGFGHAMQSLEVTFYDLHGKALATETTTPQYGYAKPARFAQWVTAPQGAARAQVTLKIDFIKAIANATSIRFAEISLLPETEALALAQERHLQAQAKRDAVKPPASPTRFDDENSGPVSSGNLALGKFYRASRPASPAFGDEYPSAWSDGSRLTDGRYQPTDSKTFEKTSLVGWRGLEPLEITIDLGRPQTLEEVLVRGFHSDEGYMFIPQSLGVCTRLDESAPWQPLGSKTVEGYENFTDTHYVIDLEVAPTQARYVRLTFQPRGEHPISSLMIGQIELLGKIKNSWRSVPSDGALHGAFPTAVGFSAEQLKGRSGMVVDLYEELVGKQLAMVLWYQRMAPGRNFIEVQRYRDDELSQNYHGTRFLQVGWEPHNLEDIISGRLDDYFANYFRDSIDPAIVGDNTDPVWFRPLSEFNGGWVDWGLDPENLRRAWWRIYNIAEQVGAASRHIFVWGPNHRSYPDAEWNKVENYWPGDQYVDWVGISAYPPSTIFVKDEDRRYPVKNIAEIYEKYADKKPFMITEGAFSDSVDRVRFVQEWFQGLKAERPKVKILVWENHNKRIISLDPQALDLYRKLVQDSYWISQTWRGEQTPPTPEPQPVTPAQP